jgi:hypothetical protein
MRKLGLTLLLLLASCNALAQNLARGQGIVQQKCDTCHTLRDEKKQPIVGLLAGGKLIGGAASANLTPDPSGISYYDEKLFSQVLRTGQVGARKLKPVMNPGCSRASPTTNSRICSPTCAPCPRSSIEWTTLSRQRCAVFVARNMEEESRISGVVL